jgi:hypothetical protein
MAADLQVSEVVDLDWGVQQEFDGGSVHGAECSCPAAITVPLQGVEDLAGQLDQGLQVGLMVELVQPRAVLVGHAGLHLLRLVL